jgi:NAD(P)-dependent dehydrogenase (short-subunit alcohol dehydrogenase family)
VASHGSVASAEGGEAIVGAALDTFGRIDAVVSNAGIFQTVGFDELSNVDWQRMLNVHLDGGFHVSQPAFRVMKSRGYGRFVFIVSSAGLFGQPEAAHYAAAKAGLVGLANVIAIEGAQHGILANTVLPFGYSRMVTETIGDREQLPDESSFLGAIDPELVVPVVVFLASRACELTHQNYSACAGRYARVFVGLGDGWLAESGSRPTADDVASHVGEISATEPFTVPSSIFDEVAHLPAARNRGLTSQNQERFAAPRSTVSRASACAGPTPTFCTMFGGIQTSSIIEKTRASADAPSIRISPARVPFASSSFI